MTTMNRGDRVRRGVQGSIRRQAGLLPWIGITASVNGINISLGLRKLLAEIELKKRGRCSLPFEL